MTDETTTEVPVTATFINVSMAQREAVAPLYVRSYGEFGPLPAFVLLDTRDGEISFATGDNQNSVPGTNCRDWMIGWQVNPLIRGSQLEPLAERLQPLMQRVLDDSWDDDFFSDEDDAIIPGRIIMGADARVASDKIISLLEYGGGIIDFSDPSHIAEVRTVGDFVDAPPDGLTATTSDAEIVELASKQESEAEAEGIVLDGVMVDWLTELRGRLRKEAEDIAQPLHPVSGSAQ